MRRPYVRLSNDQTAARVLNAPVGLPFSDDSLVEFERLIDKFGLGSMLSAMAFIATEKAEHVQTTWQDNVLAARWEWCAVHLLRAELEVIKEDLP